MTHFIRDYLLNVVIALMVLSFGSFTYNQIVHVQENIAIKALKTQPADSFFEVFSVTPTLPEYQIGSYPSFWFDSIYYVTGALEGKNVLICDGYRSQVFQASGFIGEEQVNKRPAFPNAFAVNTDLPPFTTSCFLRSEITLCSETYPQVCKTQTFDSTGFNYK